MNFKTTIILLVLLVVVGGVFWYSQANPKKEPEPAADRTTTVQGPKLMNLDAGNVKRITIATADGSRTTLEKNGESWAMTEPVKSAAVDWQTQDLIRTLCDLRSQGKPESAPADSGLDKPKYTIDLSTTDAKTVHLAIGDKNAIGDAMYAQIDGGDVNLIDSTLAKTLKTAALDLRDKHLLKVVESDVKQIRITDGNHRIMLVKDGEKWNVTEPLQLPADSETVASLLSTITGTEASEFIKNDSDDLAFADFAHPTMQVWLSTQLPTTQPTTASENAEGQTMTIGAPDSLAKGHYFVETSDGLVGKVAKTVLDSLTKKPLDLRDKDAVTIAAADVNRISIVKETYSPPPKTQPGESSPATRPTATQLVVLARRPKPAQVMGPSLTTKPTTTPTTKAEETVWMFTESADAKSAVDDSKVDALLAKFSPLRADKYLEKVPDSAWQQRYVISLEMKPGQACHLEVIRPVNGGTPYATYNDLTFEVPTAFTDALDADFHKTATAP